ncbi:pyridoxamine 5'-phosphate oxidase [Kineosporia mesophila]|uniref:Pyridoxine/pyridoxamine 5'-phosphate oxidase n=1 Tax=Kineosporia mesophila TaxID=566012 RepID=A0ABP7AAV1_9ACTN|nr:pyridoxamine 5'-phosphate oxidase [Kineosporia mesophila]MCD5351412.1 pyridoxamine 5'-phosphate oxidase [Kineosporia mesophila]
MTGTPDPWPQFAQWYDLACAQELNDPNAMALATADSAGTPDVRIVLMKEFTPEGVVFYTNTGSQKGLALAGNPRAAVTIHWKSLQRQIRLRGDVEHVSDAEADAYFASRARDSRIGAWASRQSRELSGRQELEESVARQAERFGGQDEVPRPQYWRGYRIRPVYLEFWTQRPFRLHDREIYLRPKPEADWSTTRYYP